MRFLETEFRRDVDGQRNNSIHVCTGLVNAGSSEDLIMRLLAVLVVRGIGRENLFVIELSQA